MHMRTFVFVSLYIYFPCLSFLGGHYALGYGYGMVRLSKPGCYVHGLCRHAIYVLTNAETLPPTQWPVE